MVLYPHNALELPRTSPKQIELKEPSLLDKLTIGMAKVITGVEVKSSAQNVLDEAPKTYSRVIAERENETHDTNTLRGLNASILDELDGISSQLAASLDEDNYVNLQVRLNENRGLFVAQLNELFEQLQVITTRVGSVSDSSIEALNVMSSLEALKTRDNLKEVLKSLNSYVEVQTQVIRNSAANGGGELTSTEGIDIMEVGAHNHRLFVLAQDAYDNATKASNIAETLYTAPVCDDDDDLTGVSPTLDGEEETAMTVYGNPETFAETKEQTVLFIRLLASVRTDILLRDAEIREMVTNGDMEEAYDAYFALYRTFMNLSIGVIDTIPAGFGDSISWLADIVKAARTTTRQIRRLLKSKKIPKRLRGYLNLTPDVSLFEAMSTELLDAMTGGVLPSHLVFEFRKQLQADLPRMIEFLEKIETAKKFVELEKLDAAEGQVEPSQLAEQRARIGDTLESASQPMESAAEHYYAPVAPTIIDTDYDELPEKENTLPRRPGTIFSAPVAKTHIDADLTNQPVSIWDSKSLAR